ncbi:MAG: response regulator [Magnetococcales bacterium]|nr:response regulator [Magnetococcales bacterium]
MTDDVEKPETSARNKKICEEILNHAEILLDSSLTRQQRDRLTRIRLAAKMLITNLPDEDSVDPISQKPADNSTIQEDSSIPPLNILLAEDNPFTQKLMNRLLSNNGHTLSIAANGQDALEKSQSNKFDLILMDIRMPVLDGIATANAIRQQEKKSGTAKTPIIAVTALVEESDKNRIFAAGIDGYHGKPVRAKVLNQEIVRVLRITPNGDEMKHATAEQKELLVQLDITSLLKTVDNDWTLIQEINDLFFNDAPKQLKRIQKAINNNDTNELLEASHSLKGAAGAFGDSIVYDLAYELEQLGRAKTTDSAQDSYDLLKEALASMELNLQEILEKKGDV